MTTDEYDIDTKVLELSNGEVLVTLDGTVGADCPNGHVACAFHNAYQRYIHDNTIEECLIE